jgi:hypothetical protein
MWLRTLASGALFGGVLLLTVSAVGIAGGSNADSRSGAPAYLRGVRIVQVERIGRSADMMIGIPQSALIHDGGASRVWVLDTDGGLALRPVETGRCSGEYIETIHGLKLGDRIIARGMIFEARSTLNPGQTGLASSLPVNDGRCARVTTATFSAFNVLDRPGPE